MTSKTILNTLLTSTQTETDLASLRRLLVAASISSSYCRSLLNNPVQSIHSGFGGEHFALSETTIEIISGIRAKTLAEFIHSINEKIPFHSA
ncbi:MAG: hypothetical protein RL275_3031 [Chloroflexota bacterium]